MRFSWNTTHTEQIKANAGQIQYNFCKITFFQIQKMQELLWEPDKLISDTPPLLHFIRVLKVWEAFECFYLYNINNGDHFTSMSQSNCLIACQSLIILACCFTKIFTLDVDDIRKRHCMHAGFRVIRDVRNFDIDL